MLWITIHVILPMMVLALKLFYTSWYHHPCCFAQDDIIIHDVLCMMVSLSILISTWWYSHLCCFTHDGIIIYVDLCVTIVTSMLFYMWNQYYFKKIARKWKLKRWQHHPSYFTPEGVAIDIVLHVKPKQKVARKCFKNTTEKHKIVRIASFLQL